MKRFATALALGLALTSSVAFSQELKFGFGAEMALPTGDFADAQDKPGFGGSVRLQAGLNDNFSLMGTAGFTMFPKVESAGGETNTFFVPLQAGAKFYLFKLPMTKIYTSLEGGVHIIGYKFKSDIPGVDQVSETQTNLSGAIGLGVQVKMVDLGVRYQLIAEDDNFSTSPNYIGIRLGLMFGPSL